MQNIEIFTEEKQLANKLKKNSTALMIEDGRLKP